MRYGLENLFSAKSDLTKYGACHRPLVLPPSTPVTVVMRFPFLLSLYPGRRSRP